MHSITMLFMMELNMWEAVGVKEVAFCAFQHTFDHLNKPTDTIMHMAQQVTDEAFFSSVMGELFLIGKLLESSF